MSYTVLARRFRSREFDEVIGQQPVARTLKNAIANDRIAHAYLFTGTRGVGKTSMARIFAKALNVTDDLTEKEAIADAILRGDDLDVIEIDGASNRGIDNARDLIAGAGLSPARCQYKIYIIDEVHMLTTAAFNALLKTMEEPPAHVKFILCTTETQKVPATIQSRCQRFDFRTIPVRDIATHLKMILQQEKMKADDEVVHQIARLGNGSMRDALSVLDRLLAAGESTLTMDLMEQMLGLPDQQLFQDLLQAIIDSDPASALAVGEELTARGVTVEQALELLTEHFRDLMVICSCGKETELIDLSPESKAVAVKQAAHFDAPGLVHLIALCDAVARNARGASTARALFDAVLVRLCQSAHLADIPALLEGSGGVSRTEPKQISGRESRGAVSGDISGGSVKKKAPIEHERINPSEPVDRVTEVKLPASKTDPVSDPDVWPAVLQKNASNRAVSAFLANFAFVSSRDGILTLNIVESETFVRGRIASEPKYLSQLVKDAAQRSMKVVVADSAPRDAPPLQVDDDLMKQVQSDPIVRKAMELFDATVVNIQAVDPQTQSQPTPQEST